MKTNLKWIWLCVAAAHAQQTQPPPDPSKTPPSPAAADAPAQSSLPAPADHVVTGSIELGYRWRTDPGGNENVYRSIVDLGAGPKLLDTDFSILDPKHRWFDRIDIRAANWGDDPYTTLNVTARKKRLYDFTGTYRNLAYFNNIPTFANPLLDRGVFSSEQAFDMRSRISSFDLSLLPGNWLIPYVAYDRASGYGGGVTTFVSDQNEYPVPFQSNYFQNNMRGGLRLELNRYHATVEQGGTTFHDDQSVFQSPGGSNPGNRTTPYLGTTLFLSGLSQAYGVHGHSIYTKVMGTAQPAAWLALYGQYLYARPRTETNYQQFNSGNFVSLSQVLLFTSQQYFLTSAAKVPHHAGQAGAEIRLRPRIRVITDWLTDRIRISGASVGQNAMTNGAITRRVNVADTSGLQNEYNHIEADLLWEVTSKLMLRGGYRYQWGRTADFTLPPLGLASLDAAEVRRNVGKFGFNYRRTSKLSVTGDFEGAGTDAAYYRTSLYRYDRVRLQSAYQATSHLTLTTNFSALSNQNPVPTVNGDFLGLQTSASVLWNPESDKRLGFQGTYTRATVRSDITFLIPQTLTPEQSRYRDNAHVIQGMFNFPAVRGIGGNVKFSAGGSFFISSGSRPTNYFQPTGKLIVPVGHGVSWLSEWTYYGYSESFYSFEGFRTHLVTTGIRITR